MKKYRLFNPFLPVPLLGPDALREVRPLILFSTLTAGSIIETIMTVRQKSDELKGEKDLYCENSCDKQDIEVVWGCYSLPESAVNLLREGELCLSLPQFLFRRRKIHDFTDDSPSNKIY